MSSSDELITINVENENENNSPSSSLSSTNRSELKEYVNESARKVSKMVGNMNSTKIPFMIVVRDDASPSNKLPDSLKLFIKEYKEELKGKQIILFPLFISIDTKNFNFPTQMEIDPTGAIEYKIMEAVIATFGGSYKPGNFRLPEAKKFLNEYLNVNLTKTIKTMDNIGLVFLYVQIPKQIKAESVPLFEDTLPKFIESSTILTPAQLKKKKGGKRRTVNHRKQRKTRKNNNKK